jgi:hypothetical protein
MFMKIPYIALIALSLMTSAAMSAGFPTREHRAAGDFVISYSAGDEAYADALARRLPDFKLPPVDPKAGGAVSYAQLATRREEILQRIRASLALVEPLPVMAQSFDALLTYIAGLTAAFNSGVPHRYALWRRDELRARLQAGEQIPGFSLDPPDQISVALSFQITFDNGSHHESADELSARALKIWTDFEVPLANATDPALAPDEDIAAVLGNTKQLLIDLRDSGVRGTASPFVLLHEATEVSVVEHYIGSPDRRWFCDGIANYVAHKVLADTFGADVARQYYDLDAQLQLAGAQAAHVDLERWPAVEHLAQANYSEDLNTANYAFATKVIADITEKHGDEILPRLFAELGRTPRAKVTMKAVYRAFRKLTGEDLGDYLPHTHGTRRRV